MSANKLYSEVFSDFRAAKTKEEKIAVLRDNASWDFKEFLNLAFNDRVEFDVEIPEYRPAIEPAGLNFQYLDAVIKKMYIYVKGSVRCPVGMTPAKKKSMLVVTLESLHKDEAKLLVGLLNKDLDIEFLTPALVHEAFPDLPITVE